MTRRKQDAAPRAAGLLTSVEVIRGAVEYHRADAELLHVEPSEDPLVADLAEADLSPLSGTSNGRGRVAPAPRSVAEAPWLPSGGRLDLTNGDTVEQQVRHNVTVEDGREYVDEAIVTDGEAVETDV